MTPQSVNQILRQEEISSGDLFSEGVASVRYFETNKLASNRPIEDSHSEALIHPNKADGPPGKVHFLSRGCQLS